MRDEAYGPGRIERIGVGHLLNWPRGRSLPGGIHTAGLNREVIR